MSGQFVRNTGKWAKLAQVGTTRKGGHFLLESSTFLFSNTQGKAGISCSKAVPFFSQTHKERRLVGKQCFSSLKHTLVEKQCLSSLKPAPLAQAAVAEKDWKTGVKYFKLMLTTPGVLPIHPAPLAHQCPRPLVPAPAIPLLRPLRLPSAQFLVVLLVLRLVLLLVCVLPPPPPTRTHTHPHPNARTHTHTRKCTHAHMRTHLHSAEAFWALIIRAARQGRTVQPRTLPGELAAVVSKKGFKGCRAKGSDSFSFAAICCRCTKKPRPCSRGPLQTLLLMYITPHVHLLP